MIVEAGLAYMAYKALAKPKTAGGTAATGGTGGGKEKGKGGIDQVPSQRPASYVEPPNVQAFTVDAIKAILKAAAAAVGMDPAGPLTIAKHESGFKNNAADPTSTACGLGGTLKGTAQGLGIDHSKIKDPNVSAKAITALLKENLAYAKGDWRKAFAAYAAGAGAVNTYLAAPNATEAERATWEEKRRKNWINGRWGVEKVAPARLATFREFGGKA